MEYSALNGSIVVGDVYRLSPSPMYCGLQRPSIDRLLNLFGGWYLLMGNLRGLLRCTIAIDGWGAPYVEVVAIDTHPAQCVVAGNRYR